MVNLLKNERQIEILKKRKARFKKLLYYAKGSSNMELHLRGEIMTIERELKRLK